MNVLVAGHVNWDVTMRVDRLPDADDEATIYDRQESGGGSAGNVAVALARLGNDPALLGSVGDDDHGRRATDELAAAGVDTAEVRTVGNAVTTTKYVLVEEGGEVAVLGNDGVNEAIGPDDIDRSLVDLVDHVHLTSQRPDTAARIVTLAGDAGVPVSFDPGRRLGDRSYDETLAAADIRFVTDREARRALGIDRDDPDGTVVIKQGEEGATVYTPDRTVRHAGFDVAVEDTSGAGDAFAAGYLSAIADGADLERALAVANACGALTASRNGARTAPDAEELAAFLDDRT